MSGGTFSASNWPPDCPPVDATQPDATVYRTVVNNPPLPEDFRSYVEKGMKVSKKRLCEDSGLSVMKSLAEAQHHARVFKWQPSFIAVGHLRAEHGLVKDTPYDEYPSHLTWWCFDGVDRASLFKVMES